MTNERQEPTLPLAGEIALVTGSGRGLGYCVAQRLSALGADVAIHDISEEAPAQYGESESLTAAAQALTANGGRAIGVSGDITVEADIARQVDAMKRRLEPLSILFH